MVERPGGWTPPPSLRLAASPLHRLRRSPSPFRGGTWAALVLALVAAPALAEPPADAVRAVQAAAGVTPLEAGAIRFTAVQAGGRGATVYEARRGAAGVSRTIVDLSPGAGGAWAEDSRETRPLAAETLDFFTGRIDAAIAAAPADAACDGPIYYAEHGTAGTGGGCGMDTPNAAIARALGLADAVAP